MPGRPDAGLVEHLLHQFLVPERQRLLDGHPGQAEVLADPGGEHHVGLPQALHLVDPGVPGQALQRAQHRTLVGQRDLLVVGQMIPGLGRQYVDRLVADPDDRGAGLRPGLG